MIHCKPSKHTSLLFSFLTFTFFFLTAVFPVAAQEFSPGMLDAMHWRLIGPFRGGRITSVCGVPSQPNVFYAGTPNGGVWKSNDAGRVWRPIFDREPVASIGAVAVSPSNPNIVYVGSGEQGPGDGVYKSTDAGATWVNLGLRDTHYISDVVVDPRNPDVVLVAALGDQHSRAERGVYKSTDGGKNWQKTLFKDEENGVADLQVDPDNPSILYAAMWRRPAEMFPPPEQKGQDAAIYQSTDQGFTWKVVDGKGLPSEPMGRIGIAVAPGTNGMRVYAYVRQGLFRSDDGGATFQRSTTDPRVFSSGYISEMSIDPKDANIVYAEQTSLYRSTDGGKTFEAWVGAPSGDDYHVMWINPLNTQYIILGVDQGAMVSVNGGQTWSSWYNQPTGQFYHVSTDNQFPYNVYGAQQDSGTASVMSRSNNGQITYRDWTPVGGFEFSYIEADPLNPNFIYAGGWYGSVLRYDRLTGQIVHVFARTLKYRSSNLAPVAFSPQDPHSLYVGAQYLLKSKDGGMTWREVSPDLTVKPQPAGKTPTPGEQRGNNRRAVITTMSLSHVKAGEIWVGTGNGLIQLTRDGKNWENVTVPNLPERAGVTVIEASRHDAAAAYVITQIGRGEETSVYRTRDFGKTWQPITGLPANDPTLVIRDDPERAGLLFAGTGTGVYMSFDDGDHWQSLQLNLPVTPVTDLQIHENDLVASTFGRSLWILDDITPLRQLDPKMLQADVTLLRPETAVRVRWDTYQDTPLPPETPAGKNPPDGAIIDYFLKSAVGSGVKLAVYDSQNQLVREYTDIAAPFDTTPANVPDYWFAPQEALSKNAGLNRFAWDLRYPEPKILRYGYFGEKLDYIEYTLADHAIPGEFPRPPVLGPYVVPGNYTVVLTVNGQSYRQPLTITPDPRVHVSQGDLVEQLRYAQNVSAQMNASYDSYQQVTALRDAISDRQKALASNQSGKDAADALKALDGPVAEVENGKGAEDLGVGPLNRELARYAFMIESGDAAPSEPLTEGVEQGCQQLHQRLAAWADINQNKIAPVNDLIHKYNLAPLPIASKVSSAPDCAFAGRGH
ncbi:MAG TPA: hypothetical protein VMB18_11045 [Terriglobales bacterium]|nr:hypothetical protein [Terriglobales bacterium]